MLPKGYMLLYVNATEGTMPTDGKMIIDERYKYLRRMIKRYRQSNHVKLSWLLSEIEQVTGQHRKSLIGPSGMIWPGNNVANSAVAVMGSKSTRRWNSSLRVLNSSALNDWNQTWSGWLNIWPTMPSLSCHLVRWHNWRASAQPQ